MPYAEKLGKKYRFLIYEYPFHTANADEQIDFAAKLLKALSIEKVILIGASDGGVYAQIFAKRHPERAVFDADTPSFAETGSGENGNELAAEKEHGIFEM